MEQSVIVSGFRTAIGNFEGTLKNIPASDLGAATIKKNLEDTGLDSSLIDEVIIGCVGQIAEDYLISRTCLLKAGIPATSTALSVNRVCGSGLEAINLAAMKIETKNTDIIVAGGTENLNLYPYYIRKARGGYRYGHEVLEDGLQTVYTDPNINYLMGRTAESIAGKYSISRRDQDKFALLSHKKALDAVKKGKFKDEIVPIEVRMKKETIIFDTDEHPRETSMEKLANLKPAFLENGTVTAGNSSGINDGAATVVLMSEKTAKRIALKPKVSIVSYAVAGVDPEFMGMGPIYSTKKALDKVGLKISDIDVFELNEAFAAQSLAVIRELNIPMEKINLNGGAIALGHPIGATGAILVVKIMNIMEKKGYEYGLVTLCIGGGQGITTIFKLI